MALYEKVRGLARKISGYIIDQHGQGKYLTSEEITRRKWYLALAAYYNPSIEGLYRTPITDIGQKLCDIRKWTAESGITKNMYPANLWSLYLPVKEIVNTDVASIMNEWILDNLIVRDKPKETEFLHDVLKENDWEVFFQDALIMAGSMADSYGRVALDDSKANRIRLLPYDACEVYPFLGPDIGEEDKISDSKDAAFYRIYYTFKHVDQVTAEKQIYNQYIEKEHYEVIKKDLAYYTINDEIIVNDPSLDYTVNPMVHFAHNPFGNKFYGNAACVDIIDDIDHINYCMTAMWLIVKRLMNPYTKVFGGKFKDNKLPNPGSDSYSVTLFFKDKDEGIEYLEPPPITYLDVIQYFVDEARRKMPHYKTEAVETSKIPANEDAVMAMKGSFINYAKFMANYYKRPVRNLCNAILQVGMGIREPRIIDINFGPPVSEAVQSQLNRLKEGVSVFGKREPILQKIAGIMEIDQQEANNMIQAVEVDEQRLKDAQDPMGKYLREKAESNRKKNTIEVQSKVASKDTVEEKMQFNVYQVVKAIEQNAATPVDLAMKLFDLDRATAEKRVKENAEFNLEMAEKIAEINKIMKEAEEKAKAEVQTTATAQPTQNPNDMLAEALKRRGK